jgi:mono/diheme cytochrome c family protein
MPGNSKSVLIFAGVLSAGALAVWLGLRSMMNSPAPAPTIKLAALDEDGLRQRGAYLMTVMACTDCHSPHNERGEPIPGREFSGHPENAPLPEWDPSLLQRNVLVTMAPTLTAFAGPFGTIVAPNITPDKETGIGNLRADDLIRSWRTGLHWHENRPIMPPMPAPHYKALTDEDVRAIHAFLMSLAPIKNKAPATKLPPPPTKS